MLASVWTNLSMWCGFIGGLVSIFAVIMLYLTRSNILDVFDRDKLLADQNFAIKKKSIQNAMDMVDYLVTYGEGVKKDKNYNNKCRETYNDLLCVCNSQKIIDLFIALTLNKEYSIVEGDIEHFKRECRIEMGFRRQEKKLKIRQQKAAKETETISDRDENL